MIRYEHEIIWFWVRLGNLGYWFQHGDLIAIQMLLGIKGKAFLRLNLRIIYKPWSTDHRDRYLLNRLTIS